MSIAANQWAWTRRCSPGAKLLLLALADHCNGRPGGCECWPSMARLSDMTGFSKASICRHLAELEQQGHICRVRSTGRTSTVYRLQMASQLSQNETVEPPELSQNETVGLSPSQLSQNETVEPSQLSQNETQLSQNETQRSQIETRTSKEPERTGTTLSRERAPESATIDQDRDRLAPHPLDPAARLGDLGTHPAPRSRPPAHLGTLPRLLDRQARQGRAENRLVRHLA
jgi:hypothetical protein